MFPGEAVQDASVSASVRERVSALREAVVFGMAGGDRSSSSGQLPARLMGQARRRIRSLGLLLAGLGLVVLAMVPAGVLPVGLVPSMGATVLVSLFLAGVASARRLSTQTVLRLSLGGLVAYCGIFSFAVARTRYLEYGVPGDATWTSVLLVAFPLLVPTRPRETVVALVLGALSAPLGTMWVARVTDLTLTAGELVGYALSPMAAAVIGYAGARFVYRLGLDVQRAEQLGNYRLVRRLGRGGMGEVWEARHARLARPAAIKFIGSSERTSVDGDEDDVRRFEQEAALTATLRSPHTIEVFDFGVSEDGRFYYVMELLDGMDLHRLVERYGPVPVARAVHFTRQLLDSLAEAHRRGLVHRDIKPANVFVCRYGLVDDFVKVLDFGLARQLGGEEVDRLTQDNRPRGTPAYMAPEAALGREVGVAADLYAVGCLLWWMLAGRAVFERPTPMSQLYAHANESPERLSAHVGGGIPEDLDALVLALLAKDPLERPGSAEEVRDRLDALTQVEPWTDGQAEAWWRAHGDGAATAAARVIAGAPTAAGPIGGVTHERPGAGPTAGDPVHGAPTR